MEASWAAALPTLPEIRGWSHALGAFAPLAMVGAMTLQQLLPLFPGGLLIALSGTLFGLPLGLGVVTVGTLCASAACHAVGRGPARSVIHRFAGDVRMRAVEARLAHHGVPTVAVIRAFPFVPSYVVSYGAGIAGVPLRTYLLGSLIGTMPGNFLHVLLGDRILNPRDPLFWASMGGLALLALSSFLVERRLRRR
ncbi:MAG TPA: VTT domain-containing protein [Pantanalinema sp.]